MIVGGLCIQGRGHTALPERWARTLVDPRGLADSRPRQITPRPFRQAHGTAHIMARCYDHHIEQMFGLNRIQEGWLEEHDRLMANAGG